MKITELERDAVYKTIFSRRDVRGEFLADPIPQAVLMRILKAAHHAPSVGYMQPWDFILVKSPETKAKIKQGFEHANLHAIAEFEANHPTKAGQYKQLKLEGIIEAPLGICITCEPNRNGPVIIGTTAKPHMAEYSTVCAVQNLWLAARAENIGMGWVSIIDDHVLRDALNIPSSHEIIGYFCLGYVSFFNEQPEFEKKGWLQRRPLEECIHVEQW